MEKINLIGTDISLLPSYAVALQEVNDLLSKKISGYITVNNVHTVTQAALDKHYRDILNSSLLSLPDGNPLSVVAKIKGERNISRIFGPTFMEYCLDKGRDADLKHYFFGSSEETLVKMKNVIKNSFPSAIISGSFSPPYREFTKAENEEFSEMINKAEPDLVWVGLGAPKQEIWMSENYKYLKKGIMIGIGAGFDYLAGNLRHAPGWMKNFSLEWLYRLFQDPGRLWKRYLITNPVFIVLVIMELTGIKKFD